MPHLIKSILIATIIIRGSIHTVAAQSTAIECKTISWSIQGNDHVIKDIPYQYTIQGTKINPNPTPTIGSGTEDETTQQVDSLYYEATQGSVDELLGESANVSFQLFADNTSIYQTKEKTLDYSFPAIKAYTIEAVITHPDCTYKISKQITTYNHIYTIISEKRSLLPDNLINNIEQHNNYIHQIELGSAHTEDDKKKIIADHQTQLAQSDVIFIERAKIHSTMPILEGSRDSLVGTGSLPIVIITDQEKKITEKVLTPLLRTISIGDTYLINKEQFTSLMVSLSIGEPFPQQQLDPHRRSFNQSKPTLSLSYVIDYLIYHGLSLNFIAMICGIALALLILVIRKHFIGFSSHGVFYPLLFAFSLHVVGPLTTIALGVIGALAVRLVVWFTDQMKLLYTAKMGLLIILYVILSLIGLRGIKSLSGQPESYQTFNEPLFIIVYISILMVSYAIFKKRKRNSIASWKSLGLFGILSYIVYLCISSTTIQERLVTHPLSLILTAIALVVMGRYTGLQLTEYIRFRPLIRKHFQK